jgi:hypothetical protein
MNSTLPRREDGSGLDAEGSRRPVEPLAEGARDALLPRIVKCHPAARADVGQPGFNIAEAALVRVVAVDEEEVDEGPPFPGDVGREAPVNIDLIEVRGHVALELREDVLGGSYGMARFSHTSTHARRAEGARPEAMNALDLPLNDPTSTATQPAGTWRASQ